MAAEWATGMLAVCLSETIAAARRSPQRATQPGGSQQTRPGREPSMLACAPGAIVKFRKPFVKAAEASVLLDGLAVVTLLTMDGLPAARQLARLRILVPATRGVAAAADVDGVRHATVRYTLGQVDSVAFTYSCGVTADLRHFPESETRTTSGQVRKANGRNGG